MLDAFDFWLDEMRIDAVVAKLAKRCQSGISCGVGNWGIPLICVFHSRVKCIYNSYSGLKRVPHNEAQQKLRSVQKISVGLNFSTEFDRARLGLRARGILSTRLIWGHLLQRVTSPRADDLRDGKQYHNSTPSLWQIKMLMRFCKLPRKTPGFCHVRHY